jgi:hypothetical protein
MGENDFNRNRRSRRQVSTASTVATSSISTSSNLVQMVQPPPPTVIDLTVENIEDLMMDDVQEQTAASDNETSASKNKAAKGKRKHVVTGNPKRQPSRDPRKDGKIIFIASFVSLIISKSPRTNKLEIDVNAKTSILVVLTTTSRIYD